MNVKPMAMLLMMLAGGLNRRQQDVIGYPGIKTRRPELYYPLTNPTGLERDTRSVRFGQ